MVLLVNYSIPSEQVRQTEHSVTAFIEATEMGAGTLFVTENFVIWLNGNNEGIQLEYKQITLHAISRDLQAFPREHILVHYEGKLPGMAEQRQSDDSDDEGMVPDSEPDVPLTEIRFVPENKDSLETLFEAIADCQALHPDDDCQLSDDDFEDAEEGAGDGFFNDEEGFAHLNEEGRANLERFNQMLQSGQGDAEITARTNEMRITNGHHIEDSAQEGQFQDADDDGMGEN